MASTKSSMAHSVWFPLIFPVVASFAAVEFMMRPSLRRLNVSGQSDSLMACGVV